MAARCPTTLSKSQIRKQKRLAWQRSLTVVVVDPSSTAAAHASQLSDPTTASLSQSCSQLLPSPPNTPSSATASVPPPYSHVAHIAPKDQHLLPPSPSSDHPSSDARSLSPWHAKRTHPYVVPANTPTPAANANAVSFPPGYHAPQPNSRRQRAKRRREEQQTWQNEWFRVWSLYHDPDHRHGSMIPSVQHQHAILPSPGLLHDASMPCQYSTALSPSSSHQLWYNEHITSSSSPFFTQQTPSPYP